MQELKAKELNDSNVDEVRVNEINMALEQLTAKSFNLREKYSDDLAFKSQVKWYEEGEKSNKYFLGLMKMRCKQKAISKISHRLSIGKHHWHRCFTRCSVACRQQS
jgi:hypothetical protein